jgi:dTDP-4-amino-4,6-dideoxygalactose transaminase
MSTPITAATNVNNATAPTIPLHAEQASANQEFLPFAIPSIGTEEIDEVTATLLSGWLTTGPRTKRFEAAFADYVGAPFAVAVSSATAGLHLCLAAIGVGPGDEVITTPLTFCSTANVVVHLGATPVLADVDDDFNIDPEALRVKITPRTKAIIPVHFAGQPCAMDELLAIAHEHNIFVIEDAAHALGATYHDRAIGTIGDATVFSFYATKNLTTGEGGMVTSKNPEIAEKVRLLSLHGISKDAWKRYTSEGSWYYEVTAPGYKCNMTDIQAAIGLQQLARFTSMQEQRRRIVATYDHGLADLPEIITPTTNPNVEHAWHLYVIQLDLERLTIDRAQFIEELRTRGIGASVHFIPLHLHPYYRDRFGYSLGDYPRAEYLYERIVSLPLYPRMTESDIDRVIDAVHNIVQIARR